jgi:DNA polymerase IV
VTQPSSPARNAGPGELIMQHVTTGHVTEGVTSEHVPARTVLHVDMDAFYAAVEVLLDPSLAGKPVIVGGDGPRGVVASCSYEARAYGIRSAMASTQARKLCPHAVFLAGRHGLYGEYSAQLHEVLGRFSPLIEGIALDEAFVDATGARRLSGNGEEIARSIRRAVLDELRLTCSVGVATSKLLAKLASKLAKPAPGTPGRPGEPIRPRPVEPVCGARRPGPGLLVVDPGDELAFLHPLPVRSLWGVGPATMDRLARFGVASIGDLAALSEATLIGALGSATGRHLHALAQGRDERPVEPDRAVKSVGHEETYAADVHDIAQAATELLRMGDAVAARLRAGNLRGRTITLKVKFADFRQITRSRTLAQFVDTAPAIVNTAQALLMADDVAEEISRFGARLLGVSVSNLGSGDLGTVVAEQLDLFAIQPAAGDAHSATRERSLADERVLANVTDAIRARFGDRALGSASLAGPDGLRVKRRGDTAWGPPGVGDESTAPPGVG